MSSYANLPRVAHVSNEFEVVINKGDADGIRKGQVFLLFAEGPEINDPVTGNSLGALEVIRGRGEVIHLQKRMATVRCSDKTPIYANTSSLSNFRFMAQQPIRYEDKAFKGIRVGDYARPV